MLLVLWYLDYIDFVQNESNKIDHNLSRLVTTFNLANQLHKTLGFFPHAHKIYLTDRILHVNVSSTGKGNEV